MSGLNTPNAPSESARSEDSHARDSEPASGSGGVSRHWRTLAVVLVVVLLVIASYGLYQFLTPTTPETLTKVEWTHFILPAGPAASANRTNYTTILPLTYCAPQGATTVGLFSLVWSSSSGAAIQSMVIFLLTAPSAEHPLGSPDILYEGFNESYGGTSFLSFAPVPCTYPWTFGVESSFAVSVVGIMTLTYNYTASS
jgi:hypothetical protein